jgi:hypothetical protein
MSDAELLAPVAAPDQPPPAQEPPVQAAPETPEQEDAALDKLIEEQAIDLPDGTDKLVPLSAVTTARAKLTKAREQLAEAKQGSAKADELAAKVATLEQQLHQALPYVQAYQAALNAQPQEPTGPTAEQKAALEEIARDYDFYKPDGALDLDRAGRHQARIRKEAEAIAQQQIAPIQQQTVSDRSAGFLASAKLTKGVGGQQPDPEILESVWSRLDPTVTATKAGAIQAWNIALGYSVALGKSAAPAPKEPLPPPLLTEKAGGRDMTGPTLTDDDKRMARQLNISDKEYAEELAKMPWSKR